MSGLQAPCWASLPGNGDNQRQRQQPTATATANGRSRHSPACRPWPSPVRIPGPPRNPPGQAFFPIDATWHPHRPWPGSVRSDASGTPEVPALAARDDAEDGGAPAAVPRELDRMPFVENSSPNASIMCWSSQRRPIMETFLLDRGPFVETIFPTHPSHVGPVFRAGSGKSSPRYFLLDQVPIVENPFHQLICRTLVHPAGPIVEKSSPHFSPDRVPVMENPLSSFFRQYMFSRTGPSSHRGNPAHLFIKVQRPPDLSNPPWRRRFHGKNPPSRLPRKEGLTSRAP
jgi:hypothetical protein